MKIIKLTKGLVTKVDDDDFEYLIQFKWFAHKRRYKFYAARMIRENGKRITVSMHREILGLNKSDVLCDHIDMDSLNNQRSNLRVANCSQNNANKESVKGSSSKYRGVSWLKRNKKWMVRVRKDNTEYYLGSFDSEKQAAFVYDQSAILHHGEFARLNNVFPD